MSVELAPALAARYLILIMAVKSAVSPPHIIHAYTFLLKEEAWREKFGEKNKLDIVQALDCKKS